MPTKMTPSSGADPHHARRGRRDSEAPVLIAPLELELPTTSFPSWKSIARLALPSRLELKRPEGSSSEAPLRKVIFTTFV